MLTRIEALNGGGVGEAQTQGGSGSFRVGRERHNTRDPGVESSAEGVYRGADGSDAAEASDDHAAVEADWVTGLPGERVWRSFQREVFRRRRRRRRRS